MKAAGARQGATAGTLTPDGESSIRSPVCGCCRTGDHRMNGDLPVHFSGSIRGSCPLAPDPGALSVVIGRIGGQNPVIEIRLDTSSA
jgi:hypothetical protein